MNIEPKRSGGSRKGKIKGPQRERELPRPPAGQTLQPPFSCSSAPPKVWENHESTTFAHRQPGLSPASHAPPHPTLPHPEECFLVLAVWYPTTKEDTWSSLGAEALRLELMTMGLEQGRGQDLFRISLDFSEYFCLKALSLAKSLTCHSVLF